MCPSAYAAAPAARREFRWGPLDLGPLDVVLENGADGEIHARSPFELEAFEPSVTRWLDHWADLAPTRTFLAERPSSAPHDGWRTITYHQAREATRAFAQALLNRGLGAERPLVILSGNSIAHALLALAALYAGIPYAALSPALCLASRDFARLRRTVKLLTPGLVFAEDGALYADALAALPEDTPRLLATAGPSPAERLEHWRATRETPALEQAHAAVRPETIAKFMFTSGSTGAARAVVTTHKMLCANQAMIAHVLRFLKDEPPILLDWLPWSHSFGGNQNFNLVLAHGGTLYIDAGRPTPDGIETTLANLREVSPTLHFNVPAGLESLLPRLAYDKGLAENLFRDLRLTFFAGAPLARATFDSWSGLAAARPDANMLMMSGYGATESGPATTFWTPSITADVGVGLPLPGCELRLVRMDEKLEARVKGPHVTPGYWRDPQATQDAFDEAGFFRLGDALRFADARNPRRGFCFDGRTNEDFKLATGTWVGAGRLREAVIAAFAPYAEDVVIAGDGAPFAAALVFPNFTTCQSLSGTAAPASAVCHPLVRAKFQALLDDFAAGRASSERVARLVLLASPPSTAEFSDKRSLRRASVLANRAADVASLFSATPPAQVIVAAAPAAAAEASV